MHHIDAHALSENEGFELTDQECDHLLICPNCFHNWWLQTLETIPPIT
jgi:hypothetical protein